MRRSGKTTRLIDEIIQYLFTQKEVFILKNIDNIEIYKNKPSFEKVFIDPDAKKGNMAQREMVRKLLTRLELEHDKHFVVDNSNSAYIHIKSL